MKTKLNQIQFTLLLGSIIEVVIIGLSLIGLFLGQPGWTIGASIGAVVVIVTCLLYLIGAKGEKDDLRVSMFMGAHFARLIIFVGGAVLCAVMQYVLHIEAFTNSIWAFGIAYFPVFIIVIIGSKVPMKKKEVK